MAALPSSIAAATAMADPGRILDSLSTSVLIVDRARAVLYLNVAAETLFGTSRNQARGRPLEELFADTNELVNYEATGRMTNFRQATFLNTPDLTAAKVDIGSGEDFRTWIDIEPRTWEKPSDHAPVITEIS